MVWAAVAYNRQQREESFTIATGVSGFAYLMIMVGAVMTMLGTARFVKAGIGYANLDYAYSKPFVPSNLPSGLRVPPAPDRTRWRRDDLLGGIVLLLAGAGIVGAHLVVARGVRRATGGAPHWMTRGTLVILATIAALVGLIALAIGIREWLDYALIEPARPFAEQVGLAAAFVPAWLFLTAWLVRIVRRRSPATT
jgi:hypothetical protein